MELRATWLDRAVGFLAPQAGLRRLRARVAAEMLVRHYEGASTGRRTQGWRTSIGDANTVVGPALGRLRDVARDLIRNNPNAKHALRVIGNHAVGWGIVGKPAKKNARAAKVWKEWAETPACDSDGRNDFYGLQKLVIRTVAESGECLVRRRFRRPEDGLPIPLQLQVLEPDYIDTLKTGINITSAAGQIVGKIVHGVEFDILGRRAAYWLFREHPGAEMLTAGQSTSYRVPAESVLHVYYPERPGQVRGPSWFAPVLLRFKDYDEYEDATLMKQKIAACLAVITSDTDGSAPGLGVTTAGDAGAPEIDQLEPGSILNVAPGRSVNVVNPPSVRDYADYSKTSLRAIATGLSLPYEDLTGDYSDFNFSSARMSRLSHWGDVDDWRWQMLIPQFCDPAWAWAMQAAQIMGLEGDAPVASWTAPPMPMVDPTNEGLAICRNIRTGITTYSEALRERGYDPAEVMAEMAADNKRLDDLEIILDSDPRMTTQAGLPREMQQQGAKPPGSEETKPPEPGKTPPGKTPPAADDEEDEDEDEDEDGKKKAARPRPSRR